MRYWAGFLVGACLLSGCSSDDDNSSADGTPQQQADGSYITTTSSADGTSTMRTGANVPADLPAGFLFYPGAKILSNTIIEQEEERGAIVMMESEAGVQDMITFYREKASTANIEISMDIATKSGKIIGGERADGLTFSFSAQRSRDVTLGQLTIGKSISGQSSVGQLQAQAAE